MLSAVTALLALILMCGGGSGPSIEAVAAAQAEPCRAISGPFRMRGAEILNAQNQRYIPYGIGIVGLARDLYAGTLERDKEQIAAAQKSWCANTVRLQVSQYQLIDGTGFNPAKLHVNTSFLNAVTEEVQYARGLGLMVVLNLQTQSDPDFDQTLNLPTRRSLFFWQTMAARFGHDQGVVFDLFNEPGQVGTWAKWRNGFRQGGVTYLGFQRLAEVVRTTGAKNILWVEGTMRAGSLKGAWDYHLTGVGPIMYAEHRPPQPNTVATWRPTFGYLAEKNLAPVVVGEWAQYARSDAPWACWDDAPRAVTRWLRYLESIDVGVVANKLVPGQLIQSSDYADPTIFKSDWRCENGLNQGAGLRVMHWFHRQDVPTFGHTSRIGRLTRARVAHHGWRASATVSRDGEPWARKKVALEAKAGGRWRVMKTVRSRRHGRVNVSYTSAGHVNRPMRLHSRPQGMDVGAISRVFWLPPR
jgi:hypothetical protein